MEMHDRETQELCKRLNEMAAEQRSALEAKQAELRTMIESLRPMREQSALDESRWKKQRLNAVELQRKRNMEHEMDRACEQDIAAMKQVVLHEEKDLGVITKTRGAMRQNVVNGLANGATAGVAAAVAGLGELYYLRNFVASADTFISNGFDAGCV